MNMIQAFPIQKRDGDFPCQAVVEMPVGTVPFMVIPQGVGLAVVGIGDPKMPVIAHPLIVQDVGVAFDLPIGTTAGAFIGYLHLGEGLAFVFRAEPWPKTMLDMTAPKGSA